MMALCESSMLVEYCRLVFGRCLIVDPSIVGSGDDGNIIDVVVMGG